MEASVVGNEPITSPSEEMATLAEDDLRLTEKIKGLLGEKDRVSWEAADYVYRVVTVVHSNDPGIVEAVAAEIKRSQPFVRKLRDTAERWSQNERTWDLPYWAYEQVRKTSKAAQALDKFVAHGKSSDELPTGAAYTSAALARIVKELEGIPAPSLFDQLHDRITRIGNTIQNKRNSLRPEEIRTLTADLNAAKRGLK